MAKISADKYFLCVGYIESMNLRSVTLYQWTSLKFVDDTKPNEGHNTTTLHAESRQPLFHYSIWGVVIGWPCSNIYRLMMMPLYFTIGVIMYRVLMCEGIFIYNMWTFYNNATHNAWKNFIDCKYEISSHIIVQNIAQENNHYLVITHTDTNSTLQFWHSEWDSWKTSAPGRSWFYCFS